MTVKKKIFIVAGNVQEFESYKAKKLVEWTEYGGELEGYFPEYVCVHNGLQLKGLNEIEGYYIGSYENRPDLEEIEWRIKAIKGRQNNVDNLKGIVSVNTTVGATAVGTMISNAMLPISNGGYGGTVSTIGSAINNTAVSQYSYPGPNLEQRTKALEEAIEWIKKQIDSAAS
jgi:hypothetical protein